MFQFLQHDSTFHISSIDMCVYVRYKINIPFLNIVVPCYNEEEVIQKTAEELSQILDDLIAENKILPKSRITFVDDASKDNTFRYELPVELPPKTVE